MIQLGVPAKDVITGFEGVITGRASYITGCDQYVIAPKSKDGNYQEGRWFDENRIQVLKGKPVTLPGTATKEKGGPVSNPAPTK